VSHGPGYSALAAAGLRIYFLHEHDHTLFKRFENLQARDGRYQVPEGQPRVPLMFSIRASR
jgi:hypothetical protein